MKYLLTHCHLVVDDYKEFLDGAILINEETIEDVFVNANKVEIKDANIIDCKNQIVMPAFYKQSEEFLCIDPLKENANELANKYHKENKVVLIGNSAAYKKDVGDLYYDGIYRLYENMTGFHHREEGLVNLAFENKEKYVFLDPSVLDKEVLKFTLNNLSNDRVILLGNQIENVKVLKEFSIPFTDILQMTSLNYYRLYQEDQRNGSLIKGKFADIHVFDENLELVTVIEKGEMKNV